MNDNLKMLTLAFLVLSTWLLAGYDLGAAFMHAILMGLPGCALIWIAHKAEVV